MQAKGRRILLLLDNAPSHQPNDIELENVRLLFLPPNCTAKVQPMDAGVIAAFKRHYRRFHLQNAVDRDERGETNLYKVDLLTAMRWSKAAWEEISRTTIANCFRHTGLFDAPAESAANDAEEQVVEAELSDTIQRLPLRDPVMVESLLDLVEESAMAHLEMDDDELVAMVRDAGEVAEQEEEEDATKGANFQIGKKEKLQALAITASMLDVSAPSDRALYRRIRELQKELRAQDTVQSTLDSWLMQA